MLVEQVVYELFLHKSGKSFSGWQPMNAKICNSCRVMVSRWLKDGETIPSPQWPTVQIRSLYTSCIAFTNRIFAVSSRLVAAVHL